MFGIDDLFNGIAGWANYANNARTNAQNYEMEKENLEWQKQAQQTTWNREDNAVQRRVADLRAAGMSPTLAAGSGAASSSPIATTAPQKQNAQMPEHASYGLDAIGDKAQLVMSLMKQKADISQTEAQTDLIHRQAEQLFPLQVLQAQQGYYNSIQDMKAKKQQYSTTQLNNARDDARGVKRGTPTSSATALTGDITDAVKNGGKAIFQFAGDALGKAKDALHQVLDPIIGNKW